MDATQARRAAIRVKRAGRRERERPARTGPIGRIGAICGPLIGGMIAGLAFGWEVNFYMFAAFAVIGAVVVFSVPKLTAERELEVTTRK